MFWVFNFDSCKKQGRFVCWQIQLPTGAVYSTLTLAPPWWSVSALTLTLHLHHQRDQSVTVAVIPHTTGQVFRMQLFWRLPPWLWLQISGWSWKSREKLGKMQIQLPTAVIVTNPANSHWFHLFYPASYHLLQNLYITAKWLPQPKNSRSRFFEAGWRLPLALSIQSLLTHHFALQSSTLPGLCCFTKHSWYFNLHNVLVLCTPTYTWQIYFSNTQCSRALQGKMYNTDTNLDCTGTSKLEEKQCWKRIRGRNAVLRNPHLASVHLSQGSSKLKLPALGSLHSNSSLLPTAKLSN